jgi:hypothetical protein
MRKHLVHNRNEDYKEGTKEISIRKTNHGSRGKYNLGCKINQDSKRNKKLVYKINHDYKAGIKALAKQINTTWEIKF